jgi:hypothetical protein
MDKDNKDDKDQEEAGVFGAIDGLHPVAPDSLREYEQKMSEEVIPEIVKAVEERRLLAAQSRRWQLKH